MATASGGLAAAASGAGPLVLEVRALSKSYPGTLALDRVSLQVARNEILGIAGHNGAGKSTLTRALAGAERPDSGEILIDGYSVRLRSPDEATHHGVAFVPQPLMVVPNLTARENLLLGIHRRALRQSVEATADQLHLTPYLELRAGRLRPVTQRLLMIGRALLRRPQLMILDEPTANLPQPEVELLFSIIRPLTRSGASVIYITHRLDEMLELCDRVVVTRQGRVIAESDAAALDKRRLSALIAGTDLPAAGGPANRLAQPNGLGAEVLRCEHLSALPRTRDINLVLHRGEVLGIAGLDGSGRTSLLRTLWGDRAVSGGRILVRGEAAHITGPRAAIAAGIAYLPEERAANALFPAMTVVENASLPRLRRFAGRSGMINARTELSEVGALLERLHLRPLRGAAQAKIRTLSGGNQQKVIIARWLLGSADVFLFDEPTQGIDVGAREQIYKVIGELAAEGAGIIVVSSEAEELARLCSAVHVMRQGTIARTLAGEQVTETAITHATVAAEPA